MLLREVSCRTALPARLNHLFLALGFPGFPLGPMPFAHAHTCNHPLLGTYPQQAANGAPRQSRKRPSNARFVRENLCGTRPHASALASNCPTAWPPRSLTLVPRILRSSGSAVACFIHKTFDRMVRPLPSRHGRDMLMLTRGLILILVAPFGPRLRHPR